MEYHRMNKISGAPADVELVCSQLSCQDPQVGRDRDMIKMLESCAVRELNISDQPGGLYQVWRPHNLLSSPG